MDHGSHHYLFHCSWTSDFVTWYKIHKAQYAFIMSLVTSVNLLSFFPLSIQNLKIVSELQAQFLLLSPQTMDSWNLKARWESDSYSFARSYETPLYSLNGWMTGMFSLTVYLPVTLFLHNVSPFGRPSLLIALHVKVNFSSCHVTAVLFKTFFFPISLSIAWCSTSFQIFQITPQNTNLIYYMPMLGTMAFPRCHCDVVAYKKMTAL